MRVEIYTAENLIIVGTLSSNFTTINPCHDLEKLVQILQSKSKSLPITEVLISKINLDLFWKVPFLDLQKSEIVLVRFIPNLLATQSSV